MKGLSPQPFDWSAASEDELRDEAQYWAEQGEPGDRDYMDPDEAVWTFVPAFSVAEAMSASHGSVERAAQFLTSEFSSPNVPECRKAEWRAIQRVGPLAPVVFIDRGDAKFVWDGWHRIALAAVRGDVTMPAIVGVHRSVLSTATAAGSSARDCRTA